MTVSGTSEDSDPGVPFSFEYFDIAFLHPCTATVLSLSANQIPNKQI
jgi:hypothetical protein